MDHTSSFTCKECNLKTKTCYSDSIENIKFKIVTDFPGEDDIKYKLEKYNENLNS